MENENKKRNGFATMTEGRLRSLRVFCYAQILSSLTINADIMNKKLMALTDKSMRRLMCVCVYVYCVQPGAPQLGGQRKQSHGV